MHIKCAIFVILALSVTACARHQENTNIDTTNLYQLESVRVKPHQASESSGDMGQLRVKALRDSAMSLGAQAGLASAYEQINNRMNRDRKYLDTIYNFHALVLSHGVIPPILEAGDNNLNLADPNTIRVADRSYKIIAQARFGTTAPNWREYLLQSYSKPSLPDRTLLPRTSEESKAWKEGVDAGWEMGRQQAYSIFQQSLARLKRDYNGMLLYRKLLEQRMISPPFVSRTELGVTGDGNDMRINDQVLRIVELPQLQTNSKGWKAIVVSR